MKKHRLFIIEDNRTESLVMKLAFSGFENLEVSFFDRGEALLAALGTEPDIILLDLVLPDIHGLELIRRLRARPSSARLVVLSAQEDISVVAQVQAEGVFNYVVKSDGCLRYVKQVIEDLLVVIEATSASVPAGPR